MPEISAPFRLGGTGKKTHLPWTRLCGLPRMGAVLICMSHPPFADMTSGLVNLCGATQTQVPPVTAMPATDPPRMPEDRGALLSEISRERSVDHPLFARYRIPPKQDLRPFMWILRTTIRAKRVRRRRRPVSGQKGEAPRKTNRTGSPPHPERHRGPSSTRVMVRTRRAIERHEK